MSRITHSAKQIRQRKLAWCLKVVTGFRGTIGHYKHAWKDNPCSFTTRAQFLLLDEALEQIEKSIRYDLKHL